MTSYFTVYLWEDERIDEYEDGADSAPPRLAVPAPPIEVGTRSRCALPAKLSDRFETPYRGPFSWSETATPRRVAVRERALQARR